MRDATQPKAPSVLYKGIQLTQQLFFFPFGKRIPFNCQLKMVSAAREQEWQPLYSRQQDYFQLLSLFQLQWTAVRQTMKGLVSLLFWFLSFFFCCFNCAVRIVLVISVCRSRWETGQDAHRAGNMPAAALATGGTTCPEAQTEPSWVALAPTADESVLALSPEGHLSPNAASQRTPALDLFPKLCQTKRFACVKYTKPRSFCPSTDSLSFRVNLWCHHYNGKTPFGATQPAFKKTSSPIPTAGTQLRFFSLKNYYL